MGSKSLAVTLKKLFSTCVAAVVAVGVAVPRVVSRAIVTGCGAVTESAAFSAVPGALPPPKLKKLADRVKL